MHYSSSGLVIAGIIIVVLNNTENMDVYKLGKDEIKSIKAVVEKRDVISTTRKTSGGVQSMEIEYKSDTVKDDLGEYVYNLREEGEFLLTKSMDLNVSTSEIELAKESVDEGKVIMMQIKYTPSSYTITIQKGEGDLTAY